MRQFGRRQQIPEPCDTDAGLHSIDKRGKSNYDWQTHHASYIAIWEQRAERLVDDTPLLAPIGYRDPYMQWYRKITRRLISPVSVRRDMQFWPTGTPLEAVVSLVYSF